MAEDHHKKESIVVCDLPRAGLGNQLFSLVKALVFASLNKLPVTIKGYHQIRIGPWLRREKNKRNYKGFFRFQQNVFAVFVQHLIKQRGKYYRTIYEPTLEIQTLKTSEPNCFIFNEIPHWDDFFRGLKAHRELAKLEFLKVCSPAVLAKVGSLEAPCIGVHIRMGDFRKLKEGEVFSKVGAVRTPLSYFIQAIQTIRDIHGSDLQVTIFSDGYAVEMAALLTMKNVQLVEGNNDLVDLLLLSKSQVIVTSAGSTFSYWSAFLSDAITIMHPDHIHQSIRPNMLADEMYEGILDVENVQLVRQIKSIKQVKGILNRSAL